MRRRRLLLTTVCIACISSAGGFEQDAVAAPPPGTPIVSDLAGLVRAAPLIIIGRVIKITPGRKAGKGEAQLQFNDCRVQVEQRLKGQSEPIVVVEQVDMSGRIVLNLGPPYRTGERYVLFLQPGEPGRFITIPQGRYRLHDRKVQALRLGPVADSLDGKPEAEFVQAIADVVQTAR